VSLLRHVLQFRNVNLKIIDRQARKTVRLLLAGPSADALLRALDPNGEARPGVLAYVDAGFSVEDAAVAAIVYAGPVGCASGGMSAFGRRNKPLFIVEHPASGRETAAPTTAAPPVPPARSRPATYPVAGLELAELRKHLLPDIVHVCEPVAVALASAVPAFRSPVVVRLTQDAALKSLKLAAASAVVDHVPVFGLVLGPIASAGDTIAITGVQINMLLHIAAAYGKKAEFARIIELLPVIGGGYGWRTLARELSGFIPVAGIAVKAAIAYGGTLVIGQAAAYYYETGGAMTRDRRNAAYRDAVERAKILFADVAQKLKR
jgi:uncharacterized protein (DUF697 family)